MNSLHFTFRQWLISLGIGLCLCLSPFLRNTFCGFEPDIRQATERLSVKTRFEIAGRGANLYGSSRSFLETRDPIQLNPGNFSIGPANQLFPFRSDERPIRISLANPSSTFPFVLRNCKGRRGDFQRGSKTKGGLFVSESSLDSSLFTKLHYSSLIVRTHFSVQQGLSLGGCGQ